MTFALDDLLKYISVFFWCFTRIGAAIMVMPIYGTKLLPARIRLILVLMLTLVNLPLCNKYPAIELLSVHSMLIIIQQFIIGVAIAMVLQLVFQVFNCLGDIISMQSSLSFAVLNDPATNSPVPIVSQFYIILVSCLFLAFDGHLYFCKLLLGSFQILPIDTSGLHVNSYYQIVQLISWMFANGVKMAMPAITALLIVNISFGVMTKAAPQLNIFAVGFPIAMIIAIAVIWIYLRTIDFHFNRLFEYGMDFLHTEILGGNNLGR